MKNKTGKDKKTMTHSSNEQAEIILRKDKEWSLIDSELCLVTDFSPLAGSTVEDGIVISPEKNVPYASTILECKRTDEKITGYICHEIDFLHLWAAFRERRIDEEKEEVLIYWSAKHYTNIIAKMLSAPMLFLLGGTPLPKIVVMVCPKGTYRACDDRFNWPPDRRPILFGNSRLFKTRNPNYWIPDVME